MVRVGVLESGWTELGSQNFAVDTIPDDHIVALVTLKQPDMGEVMDLQKVVASQLGVVRSPEQGRQLGSEKASDWATSCSR
jgi:hypothetical protein